MKLRNVIAAALTAAVAIAVTNQVKARRVERDLWAEAADSVD